ncbi:acyltransferase domain-containing protein [Ktedonosporobacter rubrisoli]|uniref:Phenolphthiocerol/phthiocerol polyketide synthase subunit E n=1 Tax=Ktedonosporobacter rubrisoli TaxID=2509675 RepID=A0A4P6JPS1_KTERU|nr:type I polyketide synthase [Ktedonosporobacter rubrisoli]QBD77389.1 acyltransferase domain-containing protein [Ktedonosporobacter rubrisoli]
MSKLQETHNLEGVAIIGMAGRFPGAQSIEALWQNLCSGHEAITRLSAAEDEALQRDPSLQNNPDYVPAGAFLDDIEVFDAAFFGYSAREARIIDPQQRLFLECAWQALEHAGYDATQYPGRIGVFAGAGMNLYLLEHIYPRRAELKSIDDYETMLASEKDFLATRVAYKLGLKGPAITVQTACSTSLVAVALAYQSLLNYQCDMVLAGGVALQGLERSGYLYEQGGIGSPDGHCRAFDALAQGTVGGNGLGVVVLKRLEDALADGDQIYAVIKGAAMNNDGEQKMGYTAPSIDGQAEVISEALALANVTADSIGYVEAHGTGTTIGDPIEIAALTQAFRACGASRNTFCALGSLKTNLGHLDVAAGIAGLIKTTLALHQKQLPPSLHFQSPNPQIDFAHSPFYVNTRLTEWQSGPTPRRAGVSAFGIGGTNVHVVLEEAPPLAPRTPSSAPQLLVLSARTASALETMTDQLARYLEAHPQSELADIALTLQQGRRAMPYRRMLVATSRKQASTALATRDVAQLLSSVVEPGDRSLVFLFPGQGAQYIQMGQELYATEQVYRRWIDYCAERLLPLLGLDLRTLLFPPPEQAESSALVLNRTDIAQSALFVTEYALARLLESYGVVPDTMVGHSLGEYVAACLAGVFSLDDALYLVSKRGQLMQSMPGGAMISVAASEEVMKGFLDEQLSIAVIFGPAQCIVGGSFEAIARLKQTLSEAKMVYSTLHTSHAFHSPMMDAMLEPFRQVFSQITLHAPRIPYVSCTTGTWITAQEALDATYWLKHLRQTVRLSDAIQTLLVEPGRILIEVGPDQTMKAQLRQLGPQIARSVVSVPTMRHPRDVQTDTTFLLTALGKLWLAGVPVNFSARSSGQGRRVALPTYPFERQRYWIDAKYSVLEIASQEVEKEAENTLKDSSTELMASPAEQFRSTLLNDYVAPRTEVERKVAVLWQEFLGIDEIGIYDNFFELGGHSLLAISLIARLRETFKIELQDRTLYEQSTVASLSAVIEQSKQAFLPIVPVSRTQPLLASWQQRRRWKRYQLYPEQSEYDNFSIGWILEGQLDHALFERCINEVAKRHEILRTAFDEHEQQVIQVIKPELPISIPLKDLRTLPAHERFSTMLRLAAEEEHTGFRMEQAPLWRMRLYRLDEERYAWIIVAHQAIWDGVSSEKIQHEMSIIMKALVKGEQWHLPPLTVQFADVAAWEQKRFQGELLADMLAYWREKFSGTLTPLQLPTDRPRPQEYMPSALQEWHLPRSLADRLKAVGQEQSATLYMVMLAAFNALCFHLSGQEEMLVESSFPNRDRPEMLSMVGPLANMITLRTSLAGNPGFRELLARVREAVVGAIAQRELPFVRVLEEFHPEYYTSHERPGRIFMAQYNAEEVDDDLPGLTYGERLSFRRIVSDIYYSLIDRGEYVEIVWEYSTHLFDKETINRMFADYTAFLEQVVADPERHLTDFKLLHHPISQKVV